MGHKSRLFELLFAQNNDIDSSYLAKAEKGKEIQKTLYLEVQHLSYEQKSECRNQI